MQDTVENTMADLYFNEEMEDDIAYESYLQAEENEEENELDDYDHDIE